ncbi:DoxX family protein [Nocardia puris]|uniref:DoxX family protein n=1 Tax=Nocardia puris TaxID=208602 RepID=UPI0018944E6D|nr:DoxX family protein [Nocardia puris]MBF6214131.1 DoxX family protein [Nocardia puris]MBF6365379.1 DoxX family protein [Nocardia puris]MBF6459781.1 DoxX family protein [Nocardia puris]
MNHTDQGSQRIGADRSALALLTGDAPRSLIDGALLLLRLALGVTFFAHGMDAFQNLGVSGVIDAQREAGIPLPEIAGPFTVFVELLGGPLLALGALTRPVATALGVIMVGAFAFIHAQYGLFVENGGYELVLVLAAACALLAVQGSGRFGVDGLLATRRTGNTPVRASGRV